MAEKGKNNITEKEEKSLKVKVIVLVILLVVLGTYTLYSSFLSNKVSQTSEDLSVSEKVKEQVLDYLGIDSKELTAYGDLNVSLINGGDLDIIEAYAKANNLFESEEYVNDVECISSLSETRSGMQSICYLLSEDNFNKIAHLYGLNGFMNMFPHEIYNDNMDTVYDDGEYYYVYRTFTPVGGIWNDYEYKIDSINYINSEKNIATDKISYIIKVNNEELKLLDVTVENIKG